MRFRSIQPVENLFVSIVALGEGWHNYHHIFPYDYKTAELGNYSGNLTTAFIDLCAWLGLAYDLKTVDPELVLKKAKITGDGSHSMTKGVAGEDDWKEEVIYY